MRRIMALLLTLTVIVLAGCTGSKPADEKKDAAPKKEQVLRVNVGGDPQSLDPGISTGLPEAQYEATMFEGLMRLDTEGRPVPGLAAAMPELKDNGTTYVFKLRDAKWSNGDPITADDVVYSWKRVMDPRTGSQYVDQVRYIKGADAVINVPTTQKGADGKVVKGADGKPVARPDADVKADVEKAMAGVALKALDAKTVEVKLEAPTGYFLQLAAFHTLFVVNKKAVEAHPNDWYTKPEWTITSGAFKLKSYTPKSKIIVEKNPNYYDAAKIKMDRIEFTLQESPQTATTMFESGELDMTDLVNVGELDRLKKDHPNETKVLPDLGTYYYQFNVTKAPFDNVKVRKAFALAVDRAGVAKVRNDGHIPAMAYVPGGLADATGDFRKNGGDYFKDNDVETAKKLLAEAGYPDGKGLPKLTLIYNTNDTHKIVAEAIQQMWKKNLGVDVQLTNEEFKILLDDKSKLNYQFARAGWIGDYADPMTFMDMWVTGDPAKSNNTTGWSNKEYDQLIATAKTSPDQKVRMDAMHKAEKILMDEMPLFPITFYTRPVLVNAKLKGWASPLTAGFIVRDASWGE